MGFYLIAIGAVFLTLALGWTLATALRALVAIGDRLFPSRRASVILFSDYPEDARPRREAEVLLRAGFEVDILCLRRLPNDLLRENVEGANVYRLPLERRRNGPLTYFLQYGAFLFAGFVFLSFRSFRRYRLVHVHNMPDVLVFSALVPRLLGARVILDMHDPMPELFRVLYRLDENSFTVRFLKTVEKWSTRFAHLVLTPNIAFKEVFVSRGTPPDKIKIVMNSPDEKIFNLRKYRKVDKTTGFKVMFHGSLLERNGLSLAIDALTQLRHRIQDLKLHIHGDATRHSEEMMQEVDRLGLCPNVEYHGYTLLHDMPAAILTIDLGLIPNPSNPFNEINLPTRIFEYLVMGKPAIVPRTKGILDYFQEEDLLFFEPGDAADLARKIEWAYRNPVQVQDMVKSGRMVYMKHRWKVERRSFLTAVEALLTPPFACETRSTDLFLSTQAKVESGSLVDQGFQD
jgi:glycosyltransferase involved in cell wall biosynthesis